MFNKGLFNRLLFNRFLPLFKDRTTIDLLGRLLGERNLEGLFQPFFELSGLQSVSIEKLGSLFYKYDLLGNYKIYYNLNGEMIEILSGEGAKAGVELIGRLEAAALGGVVNQEDLTGELQEAINEFQNFGDGQC